jgi:hypothetical protein
MIAGLPGTGIGGMFYVISAFVLVVRSVLQRLLGRGDRLGRRAAWRLGALTVSILAGVFATGFLIGLVFVPPAASSAHHHLAAIAVLGGLPWDRNVIRIGVLALSVATLIVVLLGVEVLRLAYVTPSTRAEAPPRVNPVADGTLG